MGERPENPPLPPGMTESAGELVLLGGARVASQILWHARSPWRPWALTASNGGRARRHTTAQFHNTFLHMKPRCVKEENNWMNNYLSHSL